MIKSLQVQVEKFLKQIASLGICSDRNVHSFQLRNEGEVGNLLGIQIKKTGPREFSLTQPGLIEKIHKVTGMSDVNGTHTPTTGAPVGADLDGLDFKEDWEYASVVGMLMYLASNTRADIAYANAACLQFAKIPKMSPLPSTLH